LTLGYALPAIVCFFSPYVGAVKHAATYILVIFQLDY